MVHPHPIPMNDSAAAPARLRATTGLLVPVGRALFAWIFIASSFNHFTAAAADYAAGRGVPLAGFFVPFSGGIALLGGLSVLFGVSARFGAWLLVIFLVPVTLFMHAFWLASDPATAQLQKAMFLKNLSMLGGALLIVHFGAGPWSVDRWAAHRRRRGFP